MFFFALFVLVCIAGAAVIAMLMRDSYTYNQLNEYITKLQTYGEDSQEEYDFRSKASQPIVDLCHLIRASRDDAKMKACANVSKSKRSPKGHGKVKK